MVGALKNSLEDKAQVVTAQNYLNPEQRAQLIPMREMSRELGVGEARLKNVIPEVEDFGEVSLSRHGRLYTYEQQEKLRKVLKERGEYAPRPDEDEISMISVARVLGIEKVKAEKLVVAARAEIGKPKIKKFGGFVLEAFNSKDLEILDRKLPELYPPDLEEFPGHLTINGMAKAMDVSVRTMHALVKHVREEDDSLGPIRVSRRGRRLNVYSPDIQAKVQALIEPFTQDESEDLMTMQAFADDLGIARSAVKNAYESNADEVGKLASKRVGKKGAQIYVDADQRVTLKRILIDTGRLVENAPEGYLSASRVAEKLQVAPYKLKEYVELCAQELGELKTYKFTTRATVGYSLEQQEVLRHAVEMQKSNR